MYRLVQLFRHFVVLLCCLFFAGCSDTSRWTHFRKGGRYQGAHPTISMDEKWIVYSSPRSGNGDLYRVSIDGRNTKRISTDPEFEGYPAISWDGKKIAFVREQHGRGRICLMKSNGTGEAVVLTDGTFDDFDPSFSPDGTRIVFTRSVGSSDLQPDSKSPFEIFMMDIDGSRQVRLTNNKVADDSPSFAPDGTRIIYNSTYRELWTMQKDGTDKRYLGEGYTGRYSSDGLRIAFISGRFARGISVMSSEGTKRQQILNSKSYKSSPTMWAESGAILFLDEPDGKGVGTICTVKVDNASVSTIVRTD